MAYKHGVYTREVETGVLPPVRVSSAIPFVVGVAPVHIFDAEERSINKVELIYSLPEAVAKFGYTADPEKWKDFTLCEFMYSQFQLFGVAPVIFVNVFDPSTHKKAVAAADHQFINDAFELSEGLIKGTAVVKSKDAEPVTYVNGVDYLENAEESKIERISSGSIPESATVSVEYSAPDITLVTSTTIIGGADTEGNVSGLELINKIYPKTGLLPGSIVSPGYSKESAVAAVMTAKAKAINTLFKCMVLIDIDDETVTQYPNVVESKNNNNLTDPCQVVCWPKVKSGDYVFHLSTQLAGLLGRTDESYSGIPYVSPSNKNLQMDGLVANGEEVLLELQQANYLNGQGVVTALNFSGGWKLWGNRTACYPSNTDPKDSWISARRMFIWVSSTLILTFWSKLDSPANRRFVETILNSAGMWLSGLVTEGALLGARVEFRDDENVITDLMDGINKFHVYMTPPSPGKEIEFIQEYDPEYFKELFA